MKLVVHSVPEETRAHASKQEKDMADKVRQVLHPEVVVYIFRHGHTLPSESGPAGDLARALSDKGIRQSDQLGQTVVAAQIEFDQVICSAAPRAQATGRGAARHFNMKGGTDHPLRDPRWYNGKGRELYCPASDEDNAALWVVTDEMERQFKNGTFVSPMGYRQFKWLDRTGTLDRFMDETRRVVSSIPGIAEASRVAFFSHAVIGNAVGEALFPQHTTKLDTIELAPCDCIRLTATSCQHVPLYT